MLTGTCNQCGLCCTVPSPHGLLVCEHLERRGSLGAPWAARCRMYATRHEGMEIVLIGPLGIAEVRSTCRKDSAIEELAIMEKGLGRGCSLALREEPRK